MGGFFSSAKKFLFGSPEKHKRVSTLLPEQQQNYGNLQNAIQNQGAGGAFGDVADYYRSNLSDNPADFDAFAAPQLRQYNEDIVPGLSEQFAGMGAGGLSSSGFRNAQVQGATDLSERLGALRANLRQNSAQGLQNLGQLGLQNFSQDVMTQPGSQGFLPSVASGAGNAIGQLGGNWLNPFGSSSGNNVGKNTGPYGNSQGSNSSANVRW